MMLLLLAGTFEARTLAQSLADEKIPAIASLAGATRDPARLPIPTRLGGFGGGPAFETYLKDNKITAIVDATHPFADKISARTAMLAAKHGLPYLQVMRPPWKAQPGDRWTSVEHEEDAARLIPTGATVFLAAGRKNLERFENLSGRRLICRQIDPTDTPFPFRGGQYHLGRPPFSVPAEVALFSRLKVDWLVVKNSGGTASAAKLKAARQLRMPVVMIERPTPVHENMAHTPEQAMEWVRGLT